MTPTLSQALEALLFCSATPLSLDDLLRTLSDYQTQPPSAEEITQALETISTRYAQSDSSLELRFIGGGYQFLTKAPYAGLVQALYKDSSKRKLSKTAMETLAIIAYEQPVTHATIESIRGVHSDYTIKKLLDHNLITIQGRSKEPGAPMLYGTSPYFLDFFGMNSLAALPSLGAYEKHLKQTD